jgi:peptidyl-prolyl cis-trans isomerase A (cyclophilin A)
MIYYGGRCSPDEALSAENQMQRTTTLPKIVIETALGPITAEIDVERAPVTGNNFLRHVDLDLYRGAAFYRAVCPLDDLNPVKISVVQGGLYKESELPTLKNIAHERTDVTGLRHLAGTLSMARDSPGTAAFEFFIVLDDSVELDAGGRRQPDREGFAAFGRVVEGMDVVRQIHRLESKPGSSLPGELVSPVPIATIRRQLA